MHVADRPEVGTLDSQASKSYVGRPAPLRLLVAVSGLAARPKRFTATRGMARSGSGLLVLRLADEPAAGPPRQQPAVGVRVFYFHAPAPLRGAASCRLAPCSINDRRRRPERRRASSWGRSRATTTRSAEHGLVNILEAGRKAMNAAAAAAAVAAGY